MASQELGCCVREVGGLLVFQNLISARRVEQVKLQRRVVNATNGARPVLVSFYSIFCE